MHSPWCTEATPSSPEAADAPAPELLVALLVQDPRLPLLLSWRSPRAWILEFLLMGRKSFHHTISTSTLTDAPSQGLQGPYPTETTFPWVSIITCR